MRSKAFLLILLSLIFIGACNQIGQRPNPQTAKDAGIQKAQVKSEENRLMARPLAVGVQDVGSAETQRQAFASAQPHSDVIREGCWGYCIYSPAEKIIKYFTKDSVYLGEFAK